MMIIKAISDIPNIIDFYCHDTCKEKGWKYQNITVLNSLPTSLEYDQICSVDRTPSKKCPSSGSSIWSCLSDGGVRISDKHGDNDIDETGAGKEGKSKLCGNRWLGVESAPWSEDEKNHGFDNEYKQDYGVNVEDGGEDLSL